MVKISYLVQRLPLLTREEFQSYWSEKHPQAAPADAFSTLGVIRYVQVLPLETAARSLVIGPRTGLVEPFDGIAELWFESEEALARDWSTDQAKAYVNIFFDVEKNLIDWKGSTILVSDENIVMP